MMEAFGLLCDGVQCRRVGQLTREYTDMPLLTPSLNVPSIHTINSILRFDNEWVRTGRQGEVCTKGGRRDVLT